MPIPSWQYTSLQCSPYLTVCGQEQMTVVYQHPHSSDLAPCYFFLSPHLKMKLMRVRLQILKHVLNTLGENNVQGLVSSALGSFIIIIALYSLPLRAMAFLNKFPLLMYFIHNIDPSYSCLPVFFLHAVEKHFYYFCNSIMCTWPSYYICPLLTLFMISGCYRFSGSCWDAVKPKNGTTLRVM